MQENNLLEYEQLEQKASEVTGRFHTLYDSIKSTEAAMRVNAELKAAVVDYAKTRPVFEGIRLQGTARNTLRSIRPTLPPIGRRRTHSGVYCPGRSSPTWIRSKPKAGSLRQRKKAAYGEYQAVRKEMQEVITAKANIDHLFGLTDERKNKEQER
ncbi:hypothetical protein QBE55_02720 [Eubacteriales bacterium mix99]